MRVLGNILWIILGGLAIAIGWALVGLILCISIIGIPFGIQAFKMAGLTLTPFGKTVQYGGGVGSALANILWVVLVGCWMALGYLGAGVLNCITIIGIPFGIQSFKMAKLALWPFWPFHGTKADLQSLVQQQSPLQGKKFLLHCAISRFPVQRCIKSSCVAARFDLSRRVFIDSRQQALR